MGLIEARSSAVAEIADRTACIGAKSEMSSFSSSQQSVIRYKSVHRWLSVSRKKNSRFLRLVSGCVLWLNDNLHHTAKVSKRRNRPRNLPARNTLV